MSLWRVFHRHRDYLWQWEWSSPHRWKILKSRTEVSLRKEKLFLKTAYTSSCLEISSLLDCPEDFRLARLHNHASQPLMINLIWILLLEGRIQKSQFPSLLCCWDTGTLPLCQLSDSSAWDLISEISNTKKEATSRTFYRMVAEASGFQGQSWIQGYFLGRSGLHGGRLSRGILECWKGWCPYQVNSAVWFWKLSLEHDSPAFQTLLGAVVCFFNKHLFYLLRVSFSPSDTCLIQTLGPEVITSYRTLGCGFGYLTQLERAALGSQLALRNGTWQSKPWVLKRVNSAISWGHLEEHIEGQVQRDLAVLPSKDMKSVRNSGPVEINWLSPATLNSLMRAAPSPTALPLSEQYSLPSLFSEALPALLLRPCNGSPAEATLPGNSNSLQVPFSLC